VPTSGIVKVDFPGKGGFSYVVINSSGKQVDHGTIAHSSASYSFDLGYLKPGLYFIMLTENKGAVYRVKIIRD
ncbi:MAG: T9SS type A sorting domain-containing protein, partial [Bacteroidota bacterium]